MRVNVVCIYFEILYVKKFSSLSRFFLLVSWLVDHNRKGLFSFNQVPVFEIMRLISWKKSLLLTDW